MVQNSVIEDFVKKIREQSEETAISFRLFINAEGFETQFFNRSAEDLRKGGISMRNLKGEFIV